MLKEVVNESGESMHTYPLERYKALRELFSDRPGATTISLDEAALRYEAEEPRSGFYDLDEEEREFVALCVRAYPNRLLDRWLK